MGSENCGMNPRIQHTKWQISGSLKPLNKRLGKRQLNGGKQEQGTVKSHLKLFCHCEIPYEKGLTKDSNCYSWSLGTKYCPSKKAYMPVDSMEKSVCTPCPV
jgi:hypothetical protein